MAITDHTPTRRGILGALAMAAPVLAVPALASRQSEGWEELAVVMERNHPEGRSIVGQAKAAGMRISDLFCILIGPTTSLCFEDDKGEMHRFYPKKGKPQ